MILLAKLETYPCQKITLDAESMYTDHAKGLQAVREVMSQHPLFESIINFLGFVNTK